MVKTLRIFLFITLFTAQMTLAQNNTELPPKVPQAPLDIKIDTPAAAVEVTVEKPITPPVAVPPVEKTTEAPATATAPAPEEQSLPTPPTPERIEKMTEAPAAIKISPRMADENKYLHEVIRRIVVFPLSTEGNFKKEAELAWWKVRDILSDQQRFLVATKRFLTQKEAYQPRQTLKIPDVVLLGKLLDTDCLITTYIDEHDLTMTAYSSQDGMTLWKKSIGFNSGKPIRLQLEELSQKLVQDFISSMPYHGFQIIDPIVNRAIIEEGSTLVAKIDVGAKSMIQPGEKVQWIDIERANTQALFQGGAKLTVYAEGTVVKNENQILIVEIKRLASSDRLTKKSMILSAEESKRLQAQYLLKDSSQPEVPLSMVVGELHSTEEKNADKKSLLTALTSILNIVIVALFIF